MRRSQGCVFVRCIGITDRRRRIVRADDGDRHGSRRRTVAIVCHHVGERVGGGLTTESESKAAFGRRGMSIGAPDYAPLQRADIDAGDGKYIAGVDVGVRWPGRQWFVRQAPCFPGHITVVSRHRDVLPARTSRLTVAGEEYTVPSHTLYTKLSGPL